MDTVAFPAADGTPGTPPAPSEPMHHASSSESAQSPTTHRDGAAGSRAHRVHVRRGRDGRAEFRPPVRSTDEASARPEVSWLRRYQTRVIATDLLAGAIAGFVAYLFRFMALSDQGTGGGSSAYLIYSPLLPLLWLIVVAANRAYEGHVVGVGPAEFQRVFRAFLYLTVLVSLVAYATKTDLARGFVVVALPLTLVLTLLGRYAARKALHRRRARGSSASAVIVVGGPKSVVELASRLRADVYAGMQVAGACLPIELCDDPESLQILADHNVALLGDLDSIRDTVALANADMVAVTSSQEIGADRLRWISWQLEDTTTDLVVSPGLVEVAGSRLHIRPILGLPLLHVEQPRFTGVHRLLKDGLDRTIAALALLFLAPAMIVIGLLVRFTSEGPALFKQVRVGRDGRLFTMVKFRSMCVDAERRLVEVTDLDDGNGMLFKVREDPRVTRVGRFLRKYSLDEVPQLFNILTGSMSLVGPRPPLPTEVEKYQDHVRRRLLVKPGITGLWQVSGRSDLSWDESVQLDLRYVENWSPVVDLMILWKTARAVVHGSGAY
jgi:exopolysaccharide biosynthesis polyprenyl glycosylphosphotransferase